MKDDQAKLLAVIFHENPFISFNDLVNQLKMKRELVRGFCKRNGGWKQVDEPFAGTRGRLSKRKRWTQGLAVVGQVVVGQAGRTDHLRAGCRAAVYQLDREHGHIRGRQRRVLRLKIGLTKVVPSGSRRFSDFHRFTTAVPDQNLGTSTGNQYGKAKSFKM